LITPENLTGRCPIKQCLLVEGHQLLEHSLLIKLRLDNLGDEFSPLDVILSTRLDLYPRPPGDGGHNNTGRNGLNIRERLWYKDVRQVLIFLRQWFLIGPIQPISPQPLLFVLASGRPGIVEPVEYQ